jgi:hypothetical protein
MRRVTQVMPSMKTNATDSKSLHACACDRCFPLSRCQVWLPDARLQSYIEIYFDFAEAKRVFSLRIRSDAWLLCR